MTHTLNKENPIAVIDSGVGGISVLRHLVRILPNENYIYFGDSLHAPYGTKSLEEVRTLTEGNVAKLLDEGCKALVIACNTATSASARRLREMYPDLPLVGIEPALKPASEFMEHPTVMVMATPMTIHQEKFRLLMARFEDQADIIPLSCPGLMDFVERCELSGENLERYLEELFYAYRNTHIDAVVLGCTHYPFVADMIPKALGYDVALFDGGEGVARQMRRLLERAGLLNPQTGKGHVEMRNSLPGGKKEAICQKLLYEDRTR